MVSLRRILGAMAYLFRLARQFMDDDHAAAAVVLLATYPFAVFYGAVYTESVFLLATVGAFYHLGRGECGRAAAWGLLAGLTRPNGFLVSLPLVLVALQPFLLARTGPARRWMWEGRPPGVSSARPSGATGLPVRLAAAVMPVLGMLTFAAYLWFLTGDALAWPRVQEAWGRSVQGFAGVASGPFRQLIEFGILASIRSMPFETLNSMAAVFAIAAVWPVTRRFGLAFGVLVAVNLAVPLAAGGVQSLGRMTSVLFPVFLWLGSALAARHRALWVFAFGSAQALVAALFFTWRQVF
jgi:hypothetical protein